jgi:hypothetical protein
MDELSNVQGRPWDDIDVRQIDRFLLPVCFTTRSY